MSMILESIPVAPLPGRPATPCPPHHYPAAAAAAAARPASAKLPPVSWETAEGGRSSRALRVDQIGNEESANHAETGPAAGKVVGVPDQYAWAAAGPGRAAKPLARPSGAREKTLLDAVRNQPAWGRVWVRVLHEAVQDAPRRKPFPLCTCQEQETKVDVVFE
ncbi:putative 11.3 kDa protein in psiA-psiB intergenic region [Frankliniella fusca]|uniref:11.3 kDa protein in psiA-psiB intergenic region n=1 Tax=Frankliniella fusca TaxID=407009 RepID=A0AAE1HD54_9NEOP|nr:putative 11.3 kDa protein in psiA-psiB intergenic region [Frankliniella fusca]